MTSITDRIRRVLSERELRGIRAAMAELSPDQAPPVNPLRPVLAGSRRNRVTAREIIADVDRRIGEMRRRR